MGRPRIARLDRERIAEAALALVDRDGDFKMPDLAKHLNVQVSSIYHHAKGRAAVVELVRNRVVREIDGSAFERLTWDDAFTAWARSYRSAFSRHPTSIRLLATETVRDPTSLSVYYAPAEGLRKAGFPDDHILAVITAAENFLLGAALDAAAPEVMIEADSTTPDDALTRALAAAPTGQARAEQAFELGWRALLSGFRRLLEELHEASARPASSS
ncbi:TetR/AcrR family transcriptional regulator [Rhodococcus sp. 24CO]|uniref:TetR/AcrR family transcriptional regulator n=1 Tax=Rhodococcus sp. 24CO TaxID=3117460 RepID=UPI003D34FDCB